MARQMFLAIGGRAVAIGAVAEIDLGMREIIGPAHHAGVPGNMPGLRGLGLQYGPPPTMLQVSIKPASEEHRQIEVARQEHGTEE